MIRRRGDDGESIFSTRDFVRFRRVPTPIASILKKIWALLTAEGADGFAMRRSFAHCIAGRELSNLEAVQYDDQLKDIFNAPPTVVLIQGSLLPDRLAPRQEQSETGSPNMAPTAQPAPNVPDPAECVRRKSFSGLVLPKISHFVFPSGISPLLPTHRTREDDRGRGRDGESQPWDDGAWERDA